MRRTTRTWQEFTIEALGTFASTVVCLVAGLISTVVVAWATASLFRIVLAPGATDARAALTAVAALFVVGAGVFLTIAILQKVADIYQRHHHHERVREAAAASHSEGPAGR